MLDKYEAPKVITLGTIEEMTAQFDKIGSVADVFTPAIPDLDGEIKTDP